MARFRGYHRPWRPGSAKSRSCQKGSGFTFVFVINFLLLISIGTAASAWTLRYTDYFPEIGGVLALGGIFSWLAFVSRLIPKETTEGLQKWFAAAMGSWIFLVFLCGLASAGVYEGGHYAAIRVDASRASEVHDAWLYEAGKGPGTPKRLGEEGRCNILVNVMRSRPANFWLKLPGRPAEQMENVTPWSRLLRYFPEEFRRTVLLLVPDPDLARLHFDDRPQLEVFVAGRHKFSILNYEWYPVWVGSSEETLYSPTIRQRLVEIQTRSGLLKWDQSQALLSPPRSDPAWYDSYECVKADWTATEYDVEKKKVVVKIKGKNFSTCLDFEVRRGSDYVQLEELSQLDCNHKAPK